MMTIRSLWSTPELGTDRIVMTDNKNKDSLDITNITTRMQENLLALGLECRETIRNSVDGFYTMRMEFVGLNWTVNGSGTTEALCRANTYKKAMAKLQHFCLPEHLMDLVEKKWGINDGFYLFPDEKRKPLKVQLINENMFEDMRDSYYQSDYVVPEDKQLIKTWVEWNNENKFTFLPFFSARKQSLQDLPFEIINRLCSSNGIASGCTVEEALCQALSDVLSRHVQEKLMRKRLTPPSIPRDNIHKVCPELYRTMENIERNSSFKIVAFDASLGIGLPVVCLALIDSESQRYRVACAGHPKFPVALEKCLAELTSGSEFGGEADWNRMVRFSAQSQRKWNTRNNWSRIFCENNGSVPSAFFFNRTSWDFQEWGINEDASDKECAACLIDKCLSLAPDVYIREQNFLGLPSVRVYVPGLSPVYAVKSLGKEHQLSKYAAKAINNLREYADNIPAQYKMELIDYFSGDYQFIHAERLGISVPLLVAALYLELGDLALAEYRSIEIEPGITAYDSPVHLALQSLYKEPSPSKDIEVVICELEMQEEGIPLPDRDRILDLFFGPECKMYISDNWRNGKILARLLELSTPREEQGMPCGFIRMKQSHKLKSLLFKLKVRMCQNAKNQ